MSETETPRPRATLVYQDHSVSLQLSWEDRAAVRIVNQIAAPFIGGDGKIADDDLISLARCLRENGFEPVGFPVLH